MGLLRQLLRQLQLLQGSTARMFRKGCASHLVTESAHIVWDRLSAMLFQHCQVLHIWHMSHSQARWNPCSG